jgi:hypothetical protein
MAQGTSSSALSRKAWVMGLGLHCGVEQMGEPGTVKLNEPAGLVRFAKCLAHPSSLLRGSPLSPIARMFWLGSLWMPTP